MSSGFREKLAKRQREVGSLVCVGLDPLLDKMPECFKAWDGTRAQAWAWMTEVIQNTAPYACMFKLQRAHWESLIQGEVAMRDVISYIREKHADIPVFLDCKRGDIGRTQERYRVTHFELDDADGVNFSPYMGKDCMAGLVDPNNLGRALVGLAYTSNPASREVQDVLLADDRPYWQFMAACIAIWAEELGVLENAGLVMAAAYEKRKDSGQIYSDHLRQARNIVGNDMWFLIPGIGTQGGFVRETVKAAFRGYGSIAINSSSGIIFADDPGRAARSLRDEINLAL